MYIFLVKNFPDKISINYHTVLQTDHIDAVANKQSLTLKTDFFLSIISFVISSLKAIKKFVRGKTAEGPSTGFDSAHQPANRTIRYRAYALF